MKTFYYFVISLHEIFIIGIIWVIVQFEAIGITDTSLFVVTQVKAKSNIDCYYTTKEYNGAFIFINAPCCQYKVGDTLSLDFYSKK